MGSLLKRAQGDPFRCEGNAKKKKTDMEEKEVPIKG